MEKPELPPLPSSCESPDTSATSLASSSDVDEADDERSAAAPPIPVPVRSNPSSRRSTPRSHRASSASSDDPLKFDMTTHFHQYRLQCVDVRDDVHSIALAAARLAVLRSFAPAYFESAPDGLLMAELAAEYSALLASTAPPTNAIRIGQLTERIRQLI